MSRVRDIADNSAVFADGISTADITEGSNLFFTNTRADARITLKMIDEDNMSSDSAAHMPSQQSVKAYVDNLRDQSQDISSEDQLRQVATISANNDTEVGELIYTAMDKVGRDGVVTIEESKTGWGFDPKNVNELALLLKNFEELSNKEVHKLEKNIRINIHKFNLDCFLLAIYNFCRKCGK